MKRPSSPPSPLVRSHTSQARNSVFLLKLEVLTSRQKAADQSLFWVAFTFLISLNSKDLSQSLAVAQTSMKFLKKWCQGTFQGCKCFSEIQNPFEVLLQPYLVSLHLRKRKDEDCGADMGREIVFLFSFYVVAFIHALLDFLTQFAKGARFLSESPRHASASVGKRKMVFT